MKSASKSINLALQGGGAHGALAWGILDYLLEDGRFEFDSVSATSAGAMNAAVLAQGLLSGGKEAARQSLRQFWEQVVEKGSRYNPIQKTPMEDFLGLKLEDTMAYHAFGLWSRMFSPYQFNPLNFNPLREILESMIDVERIRASKSIRLFLSATNVKTCKIKIFEQAEFSIDAVLASACLPFLFQAVQIGDNYYWDGGYMGNPALYPLIYQAKSPDILILHINPIQRDTLPEKSDEILNRINEISFNSSLMREMRAIAFVTGLLDKGWIKEEHQTELRRIYMHGLRMDQDMQAHSVATKLCSDKEFIEGLFQLGRARAEVWAKAHFKDLGKRSTVDLSEYL